MSITLRVYGTPAPLPERFVRKFEVDPETGCWLWTASKDRDGYGWAWLDGKNMHAHRAVWRLLNGEPEPGLVIDHLCRNRSCVNVLHMELVTPGENVRRSPLTPAGQELCLRCGGELSDWNGRQRRCIPCNDEYERGRGNKR